MILFEFEDDALRQDLPRGRGDGDASTAGTQPALHGLPPGERFGLGADARCRADVAVPALCAALVFQFAAAQPSQGEFHLLDILGLRCSKQHQPWMLSDSLRSLVELGSWEPLTKLKLEELVLQLNACEAVTDEAKQSLPLRLQLEIVGDDEMAKEDRIAVSPKRVATGSRRWKFDVLNCESQP